MFAVFAKSISCAILCGAWTSIFLHSVDACPPPQSRIEDRINKPETPQKKRPPKVPKRTVWNLDGGVFFSTTDGHLPNGACFRLSGEVNDPKFFDGLRRIDTDDGSTYTLHDKIITAFPNELFVTLHLLDFPCTLNLKDASVRPPLTREIMSTLHLNFLWKDGIAMRPVESSKRTAASARRLTPYATDVVDELTPRFEWNFAFTVASDGVPLTHNLVVIIETQDHKIAARTAARL